MVINTSALVAILCDEADAPLFEDSGAAVDRFSVSLCIVVRHLV